jgi:hypothetical protein
MSVRLRGRLDSVTNQDTSFPLEKEVNLREVCFDKQTRPCGDTAAVNPSANCSNDSVSGLSLGASLSSEARMASIDLQASYLVPDKYLLGSNLNNILPDYRNKRKYIKNQKEINYWQQKINEQLKLYTLADDKYNIKLVRGLCQIVEKYVCYDRELGETKKQIVMNCALRFFDDNAELLESIIENELEHIEKSGVWMRILAKIEIFFFAKL